MWVGFLMGLTHSDGVRGKPEERSKLYIRSTASSTARFDEEIRRMRKSHLKFTDGVGIEPFIAL